MRHSHVFNFCPIFFKMIYHVFQRMTLYGIANQRFPLISSNQYETMFCFSFYANFHFNGHFSPFYTAIMDWRKQRKTLVCISKQCNKLTNIIRYFEENCTKIEDVRVPQKRSSKKPLWLVTNQSLGMMECFGVKDK